MVKVQPWYLKSFPKNLKTLLLFFLFQALLLLVVFFPQGFDTAIGTIKPNLSIAQLKSILGLSDAGSNLSAASDLVLTGTNLEGNYAWVLNLWPPATVWMDALGIRFFGAFGVVPFVMLVSITSWAVTFTLLTWPFLKNVTWASLLLISELALLSFAPFQSWIFGAGFLYGDGLAVSSFISGLAVILYRAFNNSNWKFWLRDGIIVGLFFATSVLYRNAYQYVPIFLGILGLFFVVSVCLTQLISKKSLSKSVLLKSSLLLLSSFLVTFTVQIPYYGYIKETRQRDTLTVVENEFYPAIWKHSSDVDQWYRNAGLTVACDIAPTKCQQIKGRLSRGATFSVEEYRNMFLEAVIQNPSAYVEQRLHYISSQWSADEMMSYIDGPVDYTQGSVSYTSVRHQNIPQSLVFFGGMLFMFVASLWFAFRKKIWITLSFPVSIIAILIPFAVVHIETRYLLPLKFIALLVPLLLILNFRNRESRF